MDKLPKDLCLVVCSCHGAETLTWMRSLSKRWRWVAESETLWRVLCLELWRDKENLSSRSSPLVAVEPRGSWLSLRQWSRVPSQKPRRIAYDHDGRPATCQEFEDLVSLGWRESYILSVRDATRTSISPDELSRAPWLVTFDETAVERLSDERAPSDEASVEFLERKGATYARFSIRVARRLAWGYYIDEYYSDGVGPGRRPATWRSEEQSGNLISQLRLVSHDVIRTARRQDDWGWRISNENTFFADPLDPFGASEDEVVVVKESVDANIRQRPVWRNAVTWLPSEWPPVGLR